MLGEDTQDIETSEPEDKLWAWLDNAAMESARVRRDEAQFDRFNEFIDIYQGKHWPTIMPSFKPPIVINELRTLILSEASDLSETQPRIFITKDPRKQGRDEQAERALRAVWVKNQIDLKLTQACLWALIVGTGFLDVSFDPELENGYGDVVVECRDPRTVLPDPDAVDDRRWMFRITETVLDIIEIKRLFPVHGHKVKPEDKYSTRSGSNANPEGAQTDSYRGPLYENSTSGGDKPVGYKKARSRVLDCILQCDETEKDVEESKNQQGEPILDPITKAPKMVEKVKLKYPNGRRIVGANGIILFDGPNPNPTLNPSRPDFGLIRVILEPSLDRFWSSGFVQQTAELQVAADKLMSSVVENATRLNNGFIIAEGNTGLDFESFASIPGQILQINQGSKVEIKYPPPMPTDMIQAPWRMLDLQKRLLGFQEARAGQASRGNVSAELTETEISQSQSTTRLRSRMLYHTVQRLAEMIFARMAYGYTTKRSIPVVEGESYKPVDWIPLERPQDYSVYVDPASFTIMSRTLLKRLGTALYKLRAIDRRSLLESISWPDWEQVSGRLDAAEAAAAKAKAMSGKGGKK